MDFPIWTREEIVEHLRRRLEEAEHERTLRLVRPARRPPRVALADGLRALAAWLDGPTSAEEPRWIELPF